MTSATSLFRGCSSPHAFSGGRAPAQAASEMARATQCHQFMEFSGSWIRAFHAAPSLSAGRQYGDRMGSLADALLRPQPVSSASSAPRRMPARTPQTSSGRSAVPAGFPSAERAGSSRTAHSPGFTAAGRTNGSMGPQGSGGKTSISGSGIAGAEKSGHASGTGAAPAAASAGGVAPMRMLSAKSHSSAISLAATSHGGSTLSLSQTRQAVRAAATATAMPSQVASITSTEIRSWQDRLGKSVSAKLSVLCRGTSLLQKTPSIQDCPAAELWNREISGVAASSEQLLQALSEGAAIAAPAEFSPFVASRREEVPNAGGTPDRACATGPAAVSPAARAVPVPAAEQTVMQSLRQLGESFLSRANDEPSMALLLPSAQARESGNGNQAPATSGSPASMSRTEMSPLNEQEMDFGEDLTSLALRMKRVLDEEARRHGIDV